MMSTCRHLLVLASLSALAACASLGGAPNDQTLAGAPVVRFGESPPNSEHFILHFAAGQAIPIVSRLHGNALTQPSEQIQTVTLNRDLYVYRDWLSFDRKTWKPSRDVLDLRVNVRVPSPLHPNPGLIELKADWRS